MRHTRGRGPRRFADSARNIRDAEVIPCERLLRARGSEGPGSVVTVQSLPARFRSVGTCGVESVVVASGREMLVRLGLCRVGVRKVVWGRFFQTLWIGLPRCAGGGWRGVAGGAGRLTGWIRRHDVLLR